MRAVKSKQTKPERQLWALLASCGFRGWKINYTGVLGNPDIAFPQEKIAIFVDGCFWHACPECNRPLPQSNREYWERKINRNIERDKKYNEELAKEGWRVIRIWEHQFKKDSWDHLVVYLRKTLQPT